MIERNDETFDVDIVKDAIGSVCDLFGDKGLTVAESIHVIMSVDATLKAMYPQAYDFMRKNAQIEPFKR